MPLKLSFSCVCVSGCVIASILVRLTDLIPPSINVNSDVGDICGAEYCSEESYFYNETLYVPMVTWGTSKVLVSIWLGLAVLGLSISCAFLDSRMQEPQANHDRTTVRSILKSVKCAFQDPKLQLAAPLTLFIGLEQGFIYADFVEVNKANSFIFSIRYKTPIDQFISKLRNEFFSIDIKLHRKKSVCDV